VFVLHRGSGWRKGGKEEKRAEVKYELNVRVSKCLQHALSLHLPTFPPSLPPPYLGRPSIIRDSRKSSSVAAAKKEKTAWDGDQQYEVLPTDSFVLRPEIKVGKG